MPTTLTGSAADPTANPTATAPLDGDPANASSVNGAFQALLDFIAWIRDRMARNDADNTFAGTNTFNGATNVAAPTSSAHAARKDMGGATLNNLGTPGASGDAATKGYVDGKFPIINSQQNFGTPTAPTDVATKSYVDATLPNASGSITVNSGWSLGNTRLHRFSNNPTVLNVWFTASGASSVVIGTLPSGYRPSVPAGGAAWCNSSGGAVALFADPAGNLCTSTTASGTYYGTLVFIAQ